MDDIAVVPRHYHRDFNEAREGRGDDILTDYLPIDTAMGVLQNVYGMCLVRNLRTTSG